MLHVQQSFSVEPFDAVMGERIRGAIDQLTGVGRAIVHEVTGEAGDIAMLHSMTIHGFGPNRGSRTRSHVTRSISLGSRCSSIARTAHIRRWKRGSAVRWLVSGFIYGAGVASGLPFSTTYTAASFIGPVPVLRASCLAPAGTMNPS